MVSSASLFCDECGAANTRQATVCFACNQPLGTSPQVLLAQASTVPAISMTPVVVSTPATEPLSPGSLLAQRYRIERQVGQGGFGVVYKATDRWNRCVAIKQINLRALNTKEIIAATDSYNRELGLLSRLKHPNLPRIYDHFTDAEHWYLVIDFIEGVTLEEYLNTVGRGDKKHIFGLLPVKRSPAQGVPQVHSLPVKEVLDIGIKLCSVLNYLHTQQPPIIFRDVKPANIMRTAGGRIYLIDFGIARHFTPGQARDTGPLGSPGYAAPEQYGKAQTTVHTDIYGMGATLQTLLTGEDPLEITLAGGDKQLLAGRAVPKKLERLLNQMLEPDASKRPNSAATVKLRLKRIKTGVKGLVADFALGLLTGSMPYPLIVLLFFLTPLQIVNVANWLGMLSLVFYCIWPLFFLAQLIIGIVFLCSPPRRIVGLGILTMLALSIFRLFEGWGMPFIPNFG
jgi:hypothetical protein